MLDQLNQRLDAQDIRGSVECLRELVMAAGIDEVAQRAGVTVSEVDLVLSQGDSISVQDVRKLVQALGLKLSVESGLL